MQVKKIGMLKIAVFELNTTNLPIPIPFLYTYFKKIIKFVKYISH